MSFDSNAKFAKLKRRGEGRENENKNHTTNNSEKEKPNLHCICKHYHVAMRKIALHFNSHNKCNVCIFARMEYNVCHVTVLFVWGGLEPFSLNTATPIPHRPCSVPFRLWSRYKTCNSSISIFYICNREVLSRNSRP